MKSQESYIVLARRTRPQSFAELVGQDVISNAIQGMLSHQKIPHAFLFTGTRGTGKTSSARILAKSLCCERGPTLTPCQVCVQCMQITACAHDDVIEIDGASHTGVDNIRELREATRFYPTSARYKIFIIDEVHMLSTGAFNALLKTLEEPPPQVIFILATTELHKVPITVRSRCMIFAFKKIEAEKIVQRLKDILVQEKIAFEEDALTIIAREAKGSLRDALSLLEQVIAYCGSFSSAGNLISAESAKASLCLQGEDLAGNLFLAICEKNAGKALELLQEADLASLDLAQLMENVAHLFRQSVLIKNISDKEKVLHIAQLLPKEYDFLKNTSVAMTSTALSEIFRLLANAVKEIGKTNAGLALAEIIMIDCISRADWLSSSELISLLAQNPPPSSPSAETLSASEPVRRAIVPPAVRQPEQTSRLPERNEDCHDSDKIDMQAFKRLIAAAEKRSQTLATRLNFAKIDFFNKNLIQFSQTAENETYLSLNEKDLALFWECIHEIKMEAAVFKGFHIPKPLARTTQPKQNISENFKNFTQKNSVQNERKFANISLSDIKNKERNLKFEQNEKAVLAKEHIKEIQKLATEIQLIPLESEQD